MIDLHAHALPGLDDGPRDATAALAIARAAHDDGIETVVATPHIDHVHGVAPLDVLRAALSLRRTLTAAGVPLQLLTGGEVTVARAAELSDAELRAVALGAGSCVLLECPLRRGGPSLEEALFTLTLRGFRVLLAHPERSPDLLGDVPRVHELVERGALCSLTAGGVLGRFGARGREFSQRLLDAGLVHNVASDGHDTGGRPVALRLALGVAARGRGGEAMARWLARDVPLALLEDRALPARPAPQGRVESGCRGRRGRHS